MCTSAGPISTAKRCSGLKGRVKEIICTFDLRSDLSIWKRIVTTTGVVISMEDDDYLRSSGW